MRKVRLAELVAVPALALLVSGCLGGGSVPAELLTLTPTTAVPAGTTRSAATGGAPSRRRNVEAGRSTAAVVPAPRADTPVSSTWFR